MYPGLLSNGLSEDMPPIKVMNSSGISFVYLSNSMDGNKSLILSPVISIQIQIFIQQKKKDGFWPNPINFLQYVYQVNNNFSLPVEKKRSEVKYLKRKFTSIKLLHTRVLVGSNIRWRKFYQVAHWGVIGGGCQGWE